MNSTEATQVNTLLRWLLDPAEQPVERPVSADEACEAAAALADRSYTALHAGIDGHDVRDAWPELPAFRVGALLALVLDDEPASRPVTSAGDVL
jgi:hypothetical protein